MKILIADDHAILRKGVKLLLQEAFPFAEITEVSDSVDLLKKLMKEEYALVVSDISMPPGDNGLDTVAKIKEISPRTPVILLSMHSIEDYAVRAIKAGASAYLWKNGNAAEIVTAAKQVTSGKKYISPEVADAMADAFDRGHSRSLDKLSNRELEVFRMLAAGKATSAIAAQLNLSVHTINSFRMRIFEKMGFRNVMELIRYAVDNKLVE